MIYSVLFFLNSSLVVFKLACPFVTYLVVKFNRVHPCTNIKDRTNYFQFNFLIYNP